MRSSGILRSWNEERGFGFIAPARGGAELFVHVSAFPRDGSRPMVGETVSFELVRGPDGRPQAVKVVRGMVGSDAIPRRGAPVRAHRSGSGRWRTVLLIAVLVAGGAWGYQHFKQISHRMQLESMPAPSREPVADPTPPATRFRCDGRMHCSQMTSCAEATWFINNCPGTQMDSDKDGVPCEQQWCAAPGGR